KTKSEKNFGNYGVNGVAYTIGAKDRPDDFATGLLNNTPGPADILCWEQYVPLQPDKLPGRLGEMKDALEQPGTGVDCSGFITNCITEAKQRGLEINTLDGRYRNTMNRKNNGWTRQISSSRRRT
ncbi:MAG: hypothetical protein JRE23_14945, partial [Deltaproteobacteria bacterium]|nr:hypothetical protein [Deltaproteobacteria bacterium]